MQKIIPILKNHINLIIISLTILLSVVILANAFRNRNKAREVINVTGLGRQDYQSDLIVWNGYYSRKSMDLKEAYASLRQDKDKIEQYLVNKGVNNSEIVFSSVEINKEYDYINDREGRNQNVFSGFRLTQQVTVESKEVDKIEKIAREITELINIGVELNSQSPQYYYTKLSELKIEMIASATKDAKLRAENIAKNADVRLGNLKNAQMGIFQIIGQNSNEDYSAGGTFNTTSKMKTATITMKLQFGIR